MADSWQTYQFEFRGGLVSNLSPLQHGTQAPGTARILRNFEPSVDGGYRRIEGYDKFDSAEVLISLSTVFDRVAVDKMTLTVRALLDH